MRISLILHVSTRSTRLNSHFVVEKARRKGEMAALSVPPAEGRFAGAGYVVELTQEEIKVLRSQILTLETKPGKGQLKTPWLAAAPQLSLLNPVNLVNPVYKPAPKISRKRLRNAKPKPKW